MLLKLFQSSCLNCCFWKYKIFKHTSNNVASRLIFTRALFLSDYFWDLPYHVLSFRRTGGVLKNFANLIGKYLSWSPFSIFWKRDSWEIWEIFKNIYFWRYASIVFLIKMCYLCSTNVVCFTVFKDIVFVTKFSVICDGIFFNFHFFVTS